MFSRLLPPVKHLILPPCWTWCLIFVSVHTGRCSSGPLQRRRVTLFLHCNWVPDAEREDAIPGGLQPGEDGQTFSSPQPRVLPAAAALQTLSCWCFTAGWRLTVDFFFSHGFGRERVSWSTAVATGFALVETGGLHDINELCESQRPNYWVKVGLMLCRVSAVLSSFVPMIFL